MSAIVSHSFCSFAPSTVKFSFYKMILDEDNHKRKGFMGLGSANFSQRMYYKQISLRIPMKREYANSLY